MHVYTCSLQTGDTCRARVASGRHVTRGNVRGGPGERQGAMSGGGDVVQNRHGKGRRGRGVGKDLTNDSLNLAKCYLRKRELT